MGIQQTIFMIRTNTSKSALKSNVSIARRSLSYLWIGFWKVKTFVVCTAIRNIKRIKNSYSLIMLKKSFNGEHTMRKICSQKSSLCTPKVNIATHQMKDALVGHYLTTMRVFNAIIGQVQYVRN